MIKVEVINEDFTLERFNELKNITRKSVAEKGKLFKGDTFECDKKMVDYLTGNNPLNKVVVKVIEVVPEKIKDISPKDTKAESENIKPLNEEKLEEAKKQIEEHIQVSKNKKHSKK
jgi:hypothetical protein